MGNADGSHRLPPREFRGSHCLGVTAADGLIEEMSCHIARLPVKYTRGTCLPSMLCAQLLNSEALFFVGRLSGVSVW
jgi:hypothetical protein